MGNHGSDGKTLEIMGKTMENYGKYGEKHGKTHETELSMEDFLENHGRI